jgi:glycerophosphoryl diester phosphodiesterase
MLGLCHEGRRVTLVIAHRTCARDATENSRAGIRMAAELGADAVEVDVRLTRDGTPVLFHDALALRMAWRPTLLSWCTAARVARWRLRGSAESPPTLDEALGVLAEASLAIAIDTKAPHAAPAVLAALDRAGLRERALLWSQHEPAVRHFARHGDGAREVALLRDAMDDEAEERLLADATAFGAAAVSVHQDRLTPELVDRCRDRGLAVHCWFQDIGAQREKAALGLDGIVTDWPVQARRLLERRA